MDDVIVTLFEKIMAETKNAGASHLARMATIERLAKQGLAAREAEQTFSSTPKPALGAAAAPTSVSGEGATVVGKAGDPIQAPNTAAAQPAAAGVVGKNPATKP